MADNCIKDNALMFALDMGTTTLVGKLVDSNGEIRAHAAVFNPQHKYGADIVRRLEYACSAEGKEQLRDALMRGISEVLAAVLKEAKVNAAAVRSAVAAGNAGISVLAVGGNAAALLRPPYRPASCAATCLSLDELDVPLYLFPLVGGYVGGDLLAVLYGLEEPIPGTLVVDVGTNAEMALFDGERWLATSVAAGPAFEGGNISCGMLARAGAVRRVYVEHERFGVEVISSRHSSAAVVQPQGLCGSGVVEALALALEHGLVGVDGTIADPDAVDTNMARYIGFSPTAAGNEQQAFIRVYRDAQVDLRLTQDDIRQLQLAKGAIYAGAECLMQRAGLEPDALQRVCITGALGASIRPEILYSIALLPEYMIKKVTFIEDGVIRGLVRFLKSEDAAPALESLREKIRLYPLSGTPAFERAFVAALNF
jgi:uncharacterized 2Fe-2S/4Fe-4S cluster protein (DUF4445 family)